jgi:dihydrodipicolinate synthase/N-acetylneuraminate lyase
MPIVNKYSGVVVPMVTPFNEKHGIDRDAVSTLIKHVIGKDTHPFVLGTTGESASIPRVIKGEVVASAVLASGGKAMVYAGISGNSLYDAIEEARLYHDLGADAFVATMASYYPADDDQMLRFFEKLADEIPGPLVIYNIPTTTHLSIPIPVVDRLSRHPNVVAFKDSERSMERLKTAGALWKDRDDFSFLTGWAAKSMEAMQLGAHGIVPGTANLTPALYREICAAVLAGDDVAASAAQEKADRISALYQADRTLSRGLPVFKAMLAAYGLCQRHMMPPMYSLSADEEADLKIFLETHYGDLDRINSVGKHE